MSHGKERQEKTCLNCQTELQGYYCHVCGQENREPRDTVWGLITHFFNDITHFDGKFFSTLKYLLIRPGFLSKEYVKGRRASYLNPIRMYVFSSALFFLLFFTLFNPSQMNYEGPEEIGNRAKLSELREAGLAKARTHEDSVNIIRVFGYADSTGPKKAEPDSLHRNTPKRKREFRTDWGESGKYGSVAEYDSVQANLPEKDRDGFFRSMIVRRSVYLNHRYEGKEKEFWQDLLEKFMHSFPTILFISLPLYALFLKLLYIRRKQFYFVDHGIFLIHLYIFTFIFLIFYFGLYSLQEKYDYGLLALLNGLMILAGIFYAYKAMRNFYGQGRFKTVVKFLLLNLMAVISIIFLFGLFFGITVFRL